MPRSFFEGGDRPKLLLLIVAALVVRLVASGSGGTITDEAFTYYVSSGGPQASLNAARGDVNPPGYYLLLMPLASVTHEVFWLRLPSALLASLVPALLFLIGRRLHSPQAGSGAALLHIAAYPVWLAESQIRMYGCLAFLALLLLWMWMGARQNGRLSTGGWAALALVSALVSLVHFAGLAMVAGLFLVTAALPPIRRSAGTALAAGLLVGGLWVAYSLSGPSQDLTRTKFPPPSATQVLEAPVALVGLPALANWRGWWLVGGLLWGAALCGLVELFRRGPRPEVAALTAVFLLPTLGAVAAGLRGAQSFQSRYLVPVAGLLFLMIAVALYRGRLRWILLALVAANATLLFRYPGDPRLWNQDWKTVARFVEQHRAPGDLLAIHQPYDVLGFNFAYAPATARLDLSRQGVLAFSFLEGYPGPEQLPVAASMLGPDLEARLDRHPRIFLILSQENGPAVRRWFAERYQVEQGLALSSLHSWGNIEVFLLVRAQAPAGHRRNLPRGPA